MSDIYPAAVLSQVAAAILPAYRPNVIIIGSLAAGLLNTGCCRLYLGWGRA